MPLGRKSIRSIFPQVIRHFTPGQKSQDNLARIGRKSKDGAARYIGLKSQDNSARIGRKSKDGAARYIGLKSMDDSARFMQVLRQSAHRTKVY